MTPDYIGDVADMFKACLARRDGQSAIQVIQAVAADGHRELANRMTRDLIDARLHPSQTSR